MRFLHLCIQCKITARSTETPNSKSQAPNKSQITKYTNLKRAHRIEFVWNFEPWNLVLIWNLEIEIWKFRATHGWITPFGNPRITACLTAPRGVSPPSASFIARMSQGIHRMPSQSLFSFTCAAALAHRGTLLAKGNPFAVSQFLHFHAVCLAPGSLRYPDTLRAEPDCQCSLGLRKRLFSRLRMQPFWQT